MQRDLELVKVGRLIQFEVKRDLEEWRYTTLLITEVGLGSVKGIEVELVLNQEQGIYTGLNIPCLATDEESPTLELNDIKQIFEVDKKLTEVAKLLLRVYSE